VNGQDLSQKNKKNKMQNKLFVACLTCAVASLLLFTVCVAQKIPHYRKVFIQSVLSDAERADLIIKTKRARLNSLYHEYIAHKNKEF
jgi:hypothetical protein